MIPRPSWRLPEGLPFVLPLLLFTGLFILLPVAGTLAGSFFRDVTYLAREFAGVENYAALLRDDGLRQAARFTLLFVLVSVPLEVGLGLVFALLLGRAMPGRGIIRAVVLIPWAIPAAVSARVFELVYNYQYGLANSLLRFADPSAGPVNWLGTPAGAFLALVLADAWKTTPFTAILFLAGLAAIPEELHRQAQVDGASFLQRFFRITLPLLRPVLVVALLFRTVDALRLFDLNYVLTGGGPGGSTTSLSLYAYRYFLAGDFGFGSAVSMLLFLAALAFALTYIRLGRFGEDIR